MDPSSENKAESHAGKPPATTGELFSSAKVVADAAQSCFQGGADKIDKGKVGGAASDLLGAASHYGKLEEKGYGGYVEKAETYLQQYGSTGSAAAAAAPAAKPAPAAEAAAAPAATESSPAHAGGEAKSGGAAGSGEYVKLAQDLLGGGGEAAAKSEGGGSAEGLMKMAGGWLK